MLTKDDLQAIEGLLDTKLDEKLNSKLKPINQKLNKLQKDMNVIVHVFDSDIADLQNRTEKLETAVFMRG